MKNEAIIKSIVTLLSEYPGLSDKSKKDFKYLINQSIRALEIDKTHLHVSEKAKELWDKLNTGNIFDYHYKDIVEYKISGDPIQVRCYKGGNKKGRKIILRKTGKFEFRKIFHEDHITPVSLIFEELLGLKTKDVSSVKNILDKIHVCILLKEEDRNIPKTKGRTTDYNQVVNDEYKPNGVFI